jgi:RecB family exonuclease
VESFANRHVFGPEEELRLLLRSDVLTSGLADRTKRQLAVEAVRESTQIADEYDGVISIAVDPSTRSWSASQFTSIGQCPYRWFAQKVLELRAAQEADIKLSPAVKGNLYHKTLELAVQKALGSEDIRAAILSELEAAFVLAEADPAVGLPKLENWDIQRTEHVKAIRKTVASPEFIPAGAAIVELEKSFKTVWNGWEFSGRIDRIDRTAEGLVAIDYKTSSSAPFGAKNEAGKANIDVQLAVYTTVALPAIYPGESVKKGVYYSLTKNKVLRALTDIDPTPLEALAERVRAHLADGNFAVYPDVDGHACKYCEYDVMCRKGARLERKIRS